MHIVLAVIVGLIALAFLWDYILYIIGGGLLLIALFSVLALIRNVSTTQEEWDKKEKEKEKNTPGYKIKEKPGIGLVIMFLIIAFVGGMGGYKIICYNSDRIAENRAEYEKRLEDDKQKAKEIDEKVAHLDEKGQRIFNNLYERKWDGSISEYDKKKEAYDNTLKQIEQEKEQEKKELQKKYDDQAKYEEWIAWQKQEEERKANEELQKKYDQQAQYERWIEDQRKKGKLPEQIAAREAAAAAEKERKENTISLGDSPSKVERLKGNPNEIRKQTTDRGRFLWYTYYKNGVDYGAGVITYQFHNSSLASISENE